MKFKFIDSVEFDNSNIKILPQEWIESITSNGTGQGGLVKFKNYIYTITNIRYNLQSDYCKIFLYKSDNKDIKITRRLVVSFLKIYDKIKILDE